MLSLLLALSFSPPAHAVEVTGQIRGTVADPSGIGVPGLTVNAASDALMGTATATTDDDGNYRFPSLPPGKYTITVKADGFFPYTATGLLVITGQQAELEIKLQPASGAASVDVIAAKPVVDTQKTSSGAVLTRESMRDIPAAGRDYQGLATLAPGVVDSGNGNPNVHGSFDSSNQFSTDGVNNTDPITGTFSQNMNYDAIEEVQVVTGGMDAEYGKSLGGAVNIVTRSGGNEFHGDAQLIYSAGAPTDATTGKVAPGFTGLNLRWAKPLPNPSTPGYEIFGQYQKQSLAFNLGGPIVKDKLWFFASVQGDLHVSTQSVDPAVGRPTDTQYQPTPEVWKSAYWFGKLTWQINSANKLWIQAEGDPTHIDNAAQDPHTLPNAEYNWRQGGFSITAGHLLTPSASTLIQTNAYFQRSDLVYYAKSCEDQAGSDATLATCIKSLKDPWSAWYPDDFNNGDQPYGELSHRYRMSAQSSWTQFFSLLGEHQSKIGVSGEYLVDDDQFPGIRDWTFKESTDSPADMGTYQNLYQIRYDNEQKVHLTGSLISAYAQDVWNPIKRLTLRPGLRLDYSRLNNDIGELAFSKLTLAPRMGAAADLTGDGKTSAHAYYGRFYDSGFLAVSSILHRQSQGYKMYGWDASANNGVGDWGTSPIYTASSSSVISKDLKDPHSDNYDVGLSRDLGSGWGVDITGTYEHAQNFWEDDEVNAIWNAAGDNVIGFRNGSAESIYRIRTPDAAFTNYTDLELAINRQFDNGFSVLGSYTWSRAYGTNDGQFATATFDNPTQQNVETGLLSYDHTHSLKLIGSMRNANAIKISESVHLGYLYGWNFYILSGAPYNKLYYDQYNSGWDLYKTPTDGTYRLPAESQLDLKTGLTLAVKKTTWDLTLEVFNVFNDRTVEAVEETYGSDTGSGVYTDAAGNPIFGNPITRQHPRYAQLGLRGEF